MYIGYNSFIYITISFIIYNTNIVLSTTNHQKHAVVHSREHLVHNSSAHLNDVISDWELDLPSVVTEDTAEPVRVSGGDAGTSVPLPATHADMELIIAALGTVSSEINSLRTQVGNLKYQNHVMYKQLKKANNRCQYGGTGNIS